MQQNSMKQYVELHQLITEILTQPVITFVYMH